MDTETTAQMLVLAEASDPKGRVPYFLKRCVYAVAKKDGGDRKALSKAFAICVASAQKSGRLKSGSMEPTKKGAEWSKEKKKDRSSEFSVDEYEGMLAAARQKKESKSVPLLMILAEDSRMEPRVDEAGVKRALQQAKESMQALDAAIEGKSLVPIPGILANILTATLGRQGVFGKLGIRDLLTAVDISPIAFGKDLQIMADTFRNVTSSDIDWDVLKRLTKKAVTQLLLIIHGEIAPERVVSILGDFFLVLGAAVGKISKGIKDTRAKNAALVLRYDFQEISDGFSLLAGTA